MPFLILLLHSLRVKSVVKVLHLTSVYIAGLDFKLKYPAINAATDLFTLRLHHLYTVMLCMK